MVSPYSSEPRTVIHRGQYRHRQASRTAAATLPAKSLLAFRFLSGLSAAVLVIALRAFMVWILHF